MPRYYARKCSKYVTFSASILVALSGGLAYCFSVWSPAMKEAYGLTQGQLELIGAAHNLGGYSSFISGLVYDALERRHHVGPRISLLFGCTSSFFGFAGLWAALTNFRGFHPTVPQLALIALIAGNGGTWFDTCTLATNLRNFPASRGTVVGLVKASVGLSASLYASAYTSVFQPAADRFLLFLALMPTVVGLVAMPLVNYVPFVQRSETDRGQSIFSTEGRFLFALQSIGTLALYLMATAIVNGTHELSQATRGILGGGVIFLLLPIGLIPYGSGGLFAERMPKPGSGRASAIEEAALESGQHGRSGVDEPLLGAAPGGVETPTPEQDDDEDLPLPATITPSVTVGECFRLLNFWLLAVVCCIGIGSGLAFLNNAAQLVAALEGPEETRSVLVSLFGVASCGGRLLFGFVPENALHTYGVPRPAFLVGSAAFSTLIYALLAFATVPVLYPLALGAGFAFGAFWSLLPSLTSELFGLGAFASIYTLLQLAPAGGGYALGVVLVSKIYQEALKRHGDPGTTCIGMDCFQPAFITMSALSAVATGLSLWLLLRTLWLYRKQVGRLRTFDRDMHSGELAEGGNSETN